MILPQQLEGWRLVAGSNTPVPGGPGGLMFRCHYAAEGRIFTRDASLYGFTSVSKITKIIKNTLKKEIIIKQQQPPPPLLLLQCQLLMSSPF